MSFRPCSSSSNTLVEIGEGDGETLLSGLLACSEAPSLAHFVRSLVGLDRAAAQAAFSGFLNDRSLTPPQIRFVEMVIEGIFKTLEAVRSGSIADVG